MWSLVLTEEQDMMFTLWQKGQSLLLDAVSLSIYNERMLTL